MGERIPVNKTNGLTKLELMEINIEMILANTLLIMERQIETRTELARIAEIIEG